MINRVLTIYVQQMEQFLGSFLHQPEGLIEIAPIVSYNDDEPCKLIVSLIGLERESVQGASNIAKVENGKTYGRSLPPVLMNMNIVIASVYSKKHYRESLSVLSRAIAFIQANPSFHVPPEGKFTIELVNASWQDMSNVWSGLGGHYYPSVICKVRRLTFSADEIHRTQSDIKNVGATMG